MARSGYAKGLNSGHVTTERTLEPKKSTKGKLTKRTAMCRAIAREVAGLAPYERRIRDMIISGGSSADKRIYKFAKRRLGTHKRAVVKREGIKAIHTASKSRGGH
eukprot:CAMPEP_0172439064 /NCGR_PEP_ID=MMETSP1065-20121228/171_1 /TAXON_ID=265537 /ORGANISM="Amphiprora paludosa, Strain CCMP125" /LENGTH=104 /DNA_ID=CAMNT_0013187691 /DNA_START=82 /DNA_END=396 /DNA_ORIENTATION=-